MKTALGAYIREENIRIGLPAPLTIDENNIPKIVTIFITLDDKKDKDIIEWIKNVKSGYRCSAIKNLMRGFLAAVPAYAYNGSFTKKMSSADSAKIVEAKKNVTKKKKEDDENLFQEIMKDERPKKKELENVEDIDQTPLTLNEVFDRVDEKERKQEEEREKKRENDHKINNANNDDGFNNMNSNGPDLFDMFDDMVGSF